MVRQLHLEDTISVYSVYIDLRWYQMRFSWY